MDVGKTFPPWDVDPGITSSRRIEQGCVEQVNFMVRTGMARSDHGTICEFRTAHRRARKALFLRVLPPCGEAGMVNPCHVALDRTKVRANESRHAAMRHARMVEAEPVWSRKVAE